MKDFNAEQKAAIAVVFADALKVQHDAQWLINASRTVREEARIVREEVRAERKRRVMAQDAPKP